MRTNGSIQVGMKFHFWQFRIEVRLPWLLLFCLHHFSRKKMVVLHSYSWYEQCDVFQSVHCMVLNFLQIALLSHILIRLDVCVDLGSATPVRNLLLFLFLQPLPLHWLMSLTGPTCMCSTCFHLLEISQLRGLRQGFPSD